MAAKQIPYRLNQSVISSTEIRSRFLNYFKSKNHALIKSSSVQPFADPTLEFVNAGMNQFKNVFLGLSSAVVNRAANSQKCIRVGGKHNDLNLVGHDSYHHTFFEMLGNWSFGNYFKEEACEYALELITSSPYSLPVERLYFTYFRGDKSLNLPPDVETKKIWQHLGISEDRVIGFGLKDNFWEMGSSGPCGPCTEIHYDHMGPENRSHLVNKDLPDLTELWNIVFMQYNRLEDGSLSQLSQSYVDTGMGLERLVALLQGKSSNYDSDLFYPLFVTIQENSDAPPYRGRYGKEDVDQIDTKYRILADHSRMIAVALSDYMLPDYSHSLRRVIRKALLVADSLCPESGLELLIKVARTASHSLSHHFPQIYSNIQQVEIILKDEEKLFADVRNETRKEWSKLCEEDNRLNSLVDSQSVGLIDAYKFLKKNPASTQTLLDQDTVLTCYDRYGLNFSLIEQLASIKGYSVDRVSFDKGLVKLKEMNKMLLSSSVKIEKTVSWLRDVKPTEDRHKFSYIRDPSTSTYSVSSLQSRVEKLWLGATVLAEGQLIPNGSFVSLVLSETNFHSPINNTNNSLGHIVFKRSSNQDIILTVQQVERLHGWIIHKGVLSSPSARDDAMIVYKRWDAECFVDGPPMNSLMRNSTAASLFNFVLASKYISSMTYLNCNTNSFVAKFNLYSQPFEVNDALLCQEEVRKIINDGKDIETEVLSVEALLSSNMIPTPPYLNPNLMSYQLLSSFGSHQLDFIAPTPNVLMTGDVSDLCLTRFHLAKRNRECTVSGIAGPNLNETVYKPALHLLDTLQQSSNDKESVSGMLKEGKNHLFNNQIPLSLQKPFKEAMDNLKASVKTRR